jgi:hypothetical protein
MSEPNSGAATTLHQLPLSLKPDTRFHCLLLALCAGVLLAAALLSVRGTSSVVLPGINLPLPALCMSRRVLGIDCPGCGMTRCFIALAHGDVAAAWSFNPAGLLLFAMMAFQVPYRTLQLWRIRRGQAELSLPRTAQLALIVFAAALLVQWVVRFLPAWS